jgi:hypothetical protein
MALAARTFQVRIHYREPTYELYAGPRRKPYHWTYSIDALSPEQAKVLALAEFREMARNSSVSWTREVVLIELDGAAND